MRKVRCQAKVIGTIVTVAGARLIMLWKFINGMLPTIDVLAKVLYYTF